MKPRIKIITYNKADGAKAKNLLQLSNHILSTGYLCDKCGNWLIRPFSFSSIGDLCKCGVSPQRRPIYATS